MLASLTISALRNRVAPTQEEVMHHLKLAYERAGLVPTQASTIRILQRALLEINEAETMLEFIGRGEELPH
ncbi:hypothetical protein AC628_13865 [Bradyrhizobium sp. NAS96.2]|nr:hypothetical protein AC628_13865 [Bradyrhizobium sp. NAS96.2]